MRNRKYNVDRLLEVREQILMHPETHRQQHWASAPNSPDEPVHGCGTAYCIAGWTAILAGEKVRWFFQGRGWYANQLENGRGIAEFATEELGLSSREAEALFAGGNGIERLTRILDRLIDAGKEELLLSEEELFKAWIGRNDVDIF